MKFFTVLSVSLINCLLYAQKSQLAVKLKLSDSVIVISHEMILGSTNLAADSRNNIIKSASLINRGKLNYQIIKEKKTLSPTEVIRLSKILTYGYKPMGIKTNSCFDPHHSVIIMKNNKISFIDLCFHCRTFETSKDIKDLEIRSDKWKKLYNLFKGYGFKYEMGEEE